MTHPVKPNLANTNIVSSFPHLPNVKDGMVNRFECFQSNYVAARNIDVWLPGNYNHDTRYAVLYMHDGQMLFDHSITWNRQEWNVDETVTRLVENKKIKDVIVVGIWSNGEQRHSEYFPQQSLSYLPSNLRDMLMDELFKGKPQADDYLKFITKELKPFIDQSFSTDPAQASTFIAGSSMGALISLYALCQYPGIFGGAACLSTHWPGYTRDNSNSIPEAFASYFMEKLPGADRHSIYFDYGTRSLDSLYKPYQVKMDNIMKIKGYNSTNWTTMEFEGDDHSENSWSKRLHIPLTFLLNKNLPKARRPLSDRYSVELVH